MSYTNLHKDFANLIKVTYKDPESRPRTFLMKNRTFTYRPGKSTGLWAWYENSEMIILGIHGADDFRLNTVAIGQFIDPVRTEQEIQDFCSIHKELIEIPKPVFIAGHSLGCWVIASCELINRNDSLFGFMFAPYVPTKSSGKARFIAQTTRYEKIFYDNDWFANNLEKMSLTNALIMTPTTMPFSFVNGHSINLFVEDLSFINSDIKKTIKPTREEYEKHTDPKITNLRLLSYNVKMLDPSIFDLLSSQRASVIPRHINSIRPDVVIITELFDDSAEKIFDREMKKFGFSATKKVGADLVSEAGSTILRKGSVSIEDGGVKIYSKLPMIDTNMTTYTNKSKEDALANKGAISIEVMKNDIPIQIIGTHLQSGKKKREIRNKKKQLKQLNQELVETELATIIAGDMNIDRISQRSLLNEVLEDNDMGEFDYGGGFTTDTDFSPNPKNKWLDYVFFGKSDKYQFDGIVKRIKFKVPGGYTKSKSERTALGDPGGAFQDVGESISGAFVSKKKRKKRRKRQKRQSQMTATDLSDHHPVFIDITIKG